MKSYNKAELSYPPIQMQAFIGAALCKHLYCKISSWIALFYQRLHIDESALAPSLPSSQELILASPQDF